MIVYNTNSHGHSGKETLFRFEIACFFLKSLRRFGNHIIYL